MSDPTASKETVLWLKVMAGPIYFAFFAALIYLYADSSIDPAPPGQLGPGSGRRCAWSGSCSPPATKAGELCRGVGQEARRRRDCKEMDNSKFGVDDALARPRGARHRRCRLPDRVLFVLLVFPEPGRREENHPLVLISLLGTIGLIVCFREGRLPALADAGSGSSTTLRW